LGARWPGKGGLAAKAKNKQTTSVKSSIGQNEENKSRLKDK
jgi:hypothetical protein